MKDQEEQDDKGFRVVDRRRFTTEGEMRSDAPPDRSPPEPVPQTRAVNPEPPAPQKAQRSQNGRPQARPEPERPEDGGGQGVDFVTFVASLASTALAAMGALPPERSQGLPVDPQLAREYIDIIAMLQDKTRNNLSREEDRAVKGLLAELRMRFVESRGVGSSKKR